MRVRTWLGTGIALLLGNTSFSQQLKLGDNPYTVQKSAVLELNSTKQGLLLARISDTTAINSLAPPDGMVIFFTPTKQLLVRANGSWQFLTGGTVISSLNGLTATSQTFATGNTGTDFNIVSFGSTHTYNIPDASATARGVVTTGAQTIAGAKTLTSTLKVTATINPLTLLGVQAGTNTTADSLLTITSGLVRKLPLSTFVTAGSFWALGGNTVTTVKNFGTIDNNDLPIITNNTERMRVTSTGNVGIATTTPAAQLDVAGTFKLGATGTAQKNEISFTFAVTGGTAVPAGTASTLLSSILSGTLLTGSYAAGSIDVNVTIPSTSLPTTTHAAVSVSLDQDLPINVSIASARLTTTSNVRIRFLNNSTTAATIPANYNLYITIHEF